MRKTVSIVLAVSFVLVTVATASAGVFGYVAESPQDLVLAFERGEIGGGDYVVFGAAPSSVDQGTSDDPDIRFVFNGQFGASVTVLVDRRKAGDALVGTGRRGVIVFVGRMLTNDIRYKGGKFASGLVVRAVGTLDR